CCGPKAIMEQMIKIHQFAIMAAPTLSQYAGIEALKNGDASVEEMRQSYNQRRRYLLKELDRIGLTCFEPLGAFYIFPNIQEFQMSSEDFATQLLLEEHLAVIPGSAFGDSGEGYIRISYAYSIKELKVAINRLEQFVHRLREKALYGEVAH
ncbi:MAG: aminotransferase class I/II-fold pyridoxal phosphate-dependent enzyme, partial [Ruoffia tabacinasalis]